MFRSFCCAVSRSTTCRHTWMLAGIPDSRSKSSPLRCGDGCPSTVSKSLVHNSDLEPFSGVGADCYACLGGAPTLPKRGSEHPSHGLEYAAKTVNLSLSQRPMRALISFCGEQSSH